MMNSIVLLLFVFLHHIAATNLRCYDDNNVSFRLVEHCRACVIFIDTKITTGISQKKMFIYDQPSIEELFLYDENKHRRHRRQNTNTVIHQKCALEFDGPLYGYDQTHCYCNSNLCNSDIQRCIYEIASKRYFSCYHGSNSSQNSLEIYKKCRSCRIRKESSLTYHYECLTFGEQEQKSNTHCTCQHPMCNQDFTICQRFQQIPRVNFIHQTVQSSTKTLLTTTSLLINSTRNVITVSITNQTEQEFTTENATSIEFTSISSNETTQMNTVRIEMKSHASFFSSDIFLYLIHLFFLLRM